MNQLEGAARLLSLWWVHLAVRKILLIGGFIDADQSEWSLVRLPNLPFMTASKTVFFADRFDFQRLVSTLCVSMYAVIFLVGFLALLTHHSNWQFLYNQYALTEEANFPTWVASILWLLVAIVSYIANITDRVHNRPSKIWLLISCAFLYASMDEVCRLHERIPGWQRFYILPVMIVFTVGGPFLWKRLRDVPRSGICLVAVAFCYLMSFVLEYFVQIPSLRSSIAESGFIRKWNLVEFSEEMIELLGTALLVQVLLKYNLSRWKLFTVREPEIAENVSSAHQ